MQGLYMKVEVKNMPEFSKLVEQAQAQLEELQQTINAINAFEFKMEIK